MSVSITQPLWHDLPRGRAYPPLDGDLNVDVAVVGAGITGLTTALLLKEAGKSVAVIERLQVGAGATGHTSAHLTACLDRPYSTLASRFGEQGAKLAAASSADAIDFIEACVRRYAIDCDFLRVPGFRFAETEEQLTEMRAELASMNRLGLPATWADDVPLGFPVRGAIRLDGQAQFHPVKYLRALAELVQGGSGVILEQTAVDAVEDGEPCRLKAGGHTVTAGAVVHATHSPINLMISIHTRLAPYMTYVVAVKPAREAGDALGWDTANPYHYWRKAGPLLIVGGEDHKLGEEQDPQRRFQKLVQYAREHVAIESVEYAWSYEVLEPVDGLAFIGRKPGSDHVYVATGFSGTGLTFGTISAIVLSNLILNRETPYADLFRPTRLKPLASAGDFLKENLNAAWHFVADRLHREGDDGVDTLLPGEGRIVTVEGRKLAAYRDEEHELHLMSPVCTHAGCIVRWNPAERTWDCPCHGGRYHPTGEVMCAPPTKPLKPETPVQAAPVTKPIPPPEPAA